MIDVLEKGLKQWNLRRTEDVMERFRQYCDILTETNHVMNLTAITEPREIAALHFLDSLSVLKFTDMKGKSIIDIGSGAGFPGLPLKIVENSIILTLLDSSEKKVGFLNSLTKKLGLSDVSCLNARAEELSLKPGFRDAYDFAVSRAVAKLGMLCELCLPFVKTGGSFLSLKSRESDSELKEAGKVIDILGGKISDLFDYEIPGTDIVHRIITIEKVSSTPPGYPRRFSKIKKSGAF